MPAKVLVSTENMPYADWLEYRKQGIGGSDASVVCGISRYKSPVELWLDKTGQLPPQEAGEAAYWGTQLEPFVRAEFSKRTGIEVCHKSELLQSEEHPFMLANLDGICEVPDYGTCVFEAKTASAYKARRVGGYDPRRVYASGAALYGGHWLRRNLHCGADRRQLIQMAVR